MEDKKLTKEELITAVESMSVLELADLESGKIVSTNALAKDLGVAHTTVQGYFEVLEDCLIVERIDPITESATRKKLTKSSKYIFFDLGVRRVASLEGREVGANRRGEWFEQFVGLEIIRLIQNKPMHLKLRFWRDPDGPEVDWVIQKNRQYIPIEVKLKESPPLQDCKHLRTFLKEYECPYGAFIVCTTPRKFKIEENITVIPWKEIPSLVNDISK